MEIRLLGPFEVRTAAGEVVRITGRLRVVLTVLALSVPGPVAIESIGARVWGDDPPEHLRRSVQTLITRLRHLVGADLIVTRAGGYALELAAEAVDTHRFGRLVAAAAEAQDPEQERRLLGKALALWRGAPFTSVDSTWLQELEAPRLMEQYLTAIERRVDLELAAGTQPELVGELRELTEHHRLREPLWVRLITALERSGRPAEALTEYERVRSLLADELGADPGPELRALHARLLSPPAPTVDLAAPEQLPPGIGELIGRDAELVELDRLDPVSESSAPSIALIWGPAGAGKTSLALHWAHRHRDDFPDGQLFVNLRGYSADRPADLGLVLEGFLRALGADPQSMPATVEQRAARFRTLIGRRRMLVVLDNAGSAGQVRTLLPGPGSLVLVTSRGQLRGLAVHHQARRIEVGVLAPVEATALLARGLSVRPADRLGEIAELCGRLPLALAIVADRLALHDEALAELAADLQDELGRLDRLVDPEDPASDLRTVLSWSYQNLDEGTARVFRLLGVLPTGEFSTEVAAAVAGVTESEAGRILDGLVAASLLQVAAARRYQFHDLVRLYAAELVDGSGEQPAAWDRLLSWYVHSAEEVRAITRRFPPLGDRNLRPLPAGVRPRRFGSIGEAMDWFDSERENIGTAIARSHVDSADREVVHLGYATAVCLRYRSFAEAVPLLRIVLAAARRAGDWNAVAASASLLGGFLGLLGHEEDALRHLDDAIGVSVEHGYLPGEAAAEGNLGTVLHGIGRAEESIPHFRRALAILRPLRLAGPKGVALNNLALSLLDLGDVDDAVATASHAVAIQRETGNRVSEGHASETLANCHAARGEYAEAFDWFERALQISRELGDHRFEAEALKNLGVALRASGDLAGARSAWTSALGLIEELDVPDTPKISRDLVRRLLKSI